MAAQAVALTWQVVPFAGPGQRTQRQIDRAAAELWDLTDAELTDIQDSLADLRN